jgi:uncharacterized protein
VGTIRKFDWNKANIEHVARHAVTPGEVEEVFANGLSGVVDYARQGERRSSGVGATDAGRRLLVVFTMRRGRVRTVTAYPARSKQ